MDRLRIDKWLWAARFYKTRSLACEEIERGRVQVNGLGVKPSREVKAGDLVQLRIGVVERTLTVTGISDRRGPASVAALLFAETPESILKREQAAEQRRLAPEPALSLSEGRPTKRNRRETQRLHHWNERWSASLDQQA
jgi:ribosome-associated heat shock protein Hsp15